MWKIVTGIMTIKNKIIDQFDSHDAEVTAEIGNHGPVSKDAHASGGGRICTSTSWMAI